MSTFHVGNIAIDPGERKFGELGRVYLSDGTPVSIPLMAVRGVEDGPVLWVSAAMHGQELSGIPVVWEIVKERVDPKHLRGTVVGAPLLNPFSFNGGTYFTPEDGYNINRVFPGDPKGLLTHRLANLVYEEGIKKSDYLIDFHCNVETAMYFSIVKESPHKEAWQKSQQMARAFGITTIEMILKFEAHRSGTMGDSAGEAGKPNMTIELTPWRRIDPKAVKVGVRGVLNVMKSIGMIEGEIEPQEGVHILNGNLSRTELNATRGGLVKEIAGVGDAIKKGEVIGQILNTYGEPVEDIVSPVDGWLLAWPMISNQSAGTGEHVAFIAFEK
jgi:predicted deacylase